MRSWAPVVSILGIALLISFAQLLGAASEVLAASHLWRFSEFYSSPDGKIQFIEMVEIAGSPNENNIANHWYKTNTYNLAMTELLGSNIVGNTANKKFLVGTPSYAALPGVPAPDYMIPDGAIDPSGDTVHWWTYQVIDIPPGVMPTDGVNSISVVDPVTPSYSVGVNSPTNFAGETGTVVLPPAVPALGVRGRALLAAITVLLGAILWSRRSGTHSASG